MFPSNVLNIGHFANNRPELRQLSYALEVFANLRLAPKGFAILPAAMWASSWNHSIAAGASGAVRAYRSNSMSGRHITNSKAITANALLNPTTAACQLIS